MNGGWGGLHVGGAAAAKTQPSEMSERRWTSLSRGSHAASWLSHVVPVATCFHLSCRGQPGGMKKGEMRRKNGDTNVNVLLFVAGRGRSFTC